MPSVLTSPPAVTDILKKTVIFSILIGAILAGGLAIYHSYGWFRGDVLDYIKGNYLVDGQQIVSGEYLESGADEQGEYVIWQVITDDGRSHFLRLDVVFHRYLTRIGPDYKIRGIREIPDYTEDTKPLS